MYDDEMFPGIIVEINDRDSLVDFMEECFGGRNCYSWPQKRINYYTIIIIYYVK